MIPHISQSWIHSTLGSHWPCLSSLQRTVQIPHGPGGVSEDAGFWIWKSLAAPCPLLFWVQKEPQEGLAPMPGRERDHQTCP